MKGKIDLGIEKSIDLFIEDIKHEKTKYIVIELKYGGFQISIVNKDFYKVFDNIHNITESIRLLYFLYHKYDYKEVLIDVGWFFKAFRIQFQDKGLLFNLKFVPRGYPYSIIDYLSDTKTLIIDNNLVDIIWQLHIKLDEGQPCEHKGCINHDTHPCENCFRISGLRKRRLH